MAGATGGKGFVTFVPIVVTRTDQRVDDEPNQPVEESLNIGTNTPRNESPGCLNHFRGGADRFHPIPDADSATSAYEWLERMSAAMSQMSYQGTFVYVQGDVETMRITHVSDRTGVRERLVSISGVQREILRDSSGVRWVQGDDHSLMEDPAVGRSFFPEISVGDLLKSPIISFQVGDSARIAGHSGRQVKIVPLDRYRYGYTSLVGSAV